MQIYFVIFAAALATSAALTPLVRWLAGRVGAVSEPSARDVHSGTIPRMGGLAITAGFSAPVIFVFLARGVIGDALRAQRPMVWAILVGGLAICLLGAADDVRGLRARWKLAGQIAVGAGAFAVGFRIHAVWMPFVGALDMGVFALPVTLLWIVGVTNAINLIDGLDGLAAGVSFFAATTNFILALVSGNLIVAVFSAGLMGAVVGFLFYNFNPARIFMGDSGSYFLGYVLSLISLTGASHKTSTAVSILVPILALGVPIFDTLFSMARRMTLGRPLFSPDRGHIHHRLLDLGLTHRRAVLFLYGICVLFTGGAIAISLNRSWYTGAGLVGGSALVFVLVRFVRGLTALNARTRRAVGLGDAENSMLLATLGQVVDGVVHASSEAAVFESLATLVASGKVARLNVSMRSRDPCPPTIFTVGVVPVGSRDVVTGNYLLGTDADARAEVRLAWRSPGEYVSPTHDALFHLLAHLSALALTRVGSRCGPTPSSSITDDSRLSVPVPSTLSKVVR